MGVELVITVHEHEWSVGSGHNRRFWLGPLRGSQLPRPGDLFYPLGGEPELELEVVRVDWSWVSTAPELLATVRLQDVVLNPTGVAWNNMDALRRSRTLSGERHQVPAAWTEDEGDVPLYQRLYDEGWEERR